MVKNRKKQSKIKIFSGPRSSFLVFVLLLTTYYLLHTTSAAAQYGFTDFLDKVPGGEFDITWFFTLINNLACRFIQFAIIVFVIMLIVYGLMFFKGRGTPQGMTDSKKALTWGLVGGLVIFSVFTIILSVASFVGVDYPVISRISC
jgi:hypothetical protein